MHKINKKISYSQMVFKEKTSIWLKEDTLLVIFKHIHFSFIFITANAKHQYFIAKQERLFKQIVYMLMKYNRFIYAKTNIKAKIKRI